MVKIGDRIELLETTDSYLKPGFKGRVTNISTTKVSEQYIIEVNWDDGTNLALIEGEDRFKVIERVDS